MEFYKIKLKIVSPVHCGNKQWGFVQSSRDFVPPWTIHGALSVLFVENNQYRATYDKMVKCCFISPFYPAVDRNNEEIILAPDKKYTKKIKIDSLTFSIGSTSLESNRTKTEDSGGALHRFEYISPKIRIYDINEIITHDLFLVGYVGFDNNDSDGRKFIDKLKDLENKGITIGGNRAQGMGECVINEIEKKEITSLDFFIKDHPAVIKVDGGIQIKGITEKLSLRTTLNNKKFGLEYLGDLNEVFVPPYEVEDGYFVEKYSIYSLILSKK